MFVYDKINMYVVGVGERSAILASDCAPNITVHTFVGSALGESSGEPNPGSGPWWIYLAVVGRSAL